MLHAKAEKVLQPFEFLHASKCARAFPPSPKLRQLFCAQADSKARGLKNETINRHRIIFNQLAAFAEARGIKNLNQFRCIVGNRRLFLSAIPDRQTTDLAYCDPAVLARALHAA